MTTPHETSRDDVESPRAQRQLAQRNLTREQLLDTAEAMFSEQGFDRTPLRAIAEAVEMSVGAVYLIFENKEALYRAVFARRIDTFVSSLLPSITSDVSAFDRLHALLDYVFDFYRKYPTYTRLMLRHVGPTLFVGADFVDASLAPGYVQADSEIIAAVIEYGQSTGEFRPGDPRTMMHFISAIVLTQLASDPELVGSAEATTPFAFDEFSSIVRRVVEPLSPS